jgi:hypothetical protein
MVGVPVKPKYGYGPPSDSSDFGRCYRLLELFPEWRPMIKKMSRKGRVWKNLVDNWDELERLYIKELPSGNAPKLYAKMKECWR